MSGAFGSDCAVSDVIFNLIVTLLPIFSFLGLFCRIYKYQKSKIIVKSEKKWEGKWGSFISVG